MIIITLKIPRTQENGIKYTGDADKFLNMPITHDEQVVGVITKIISNSDDYVNVEGTLYKTGVNLYKINDYYHPADIEIR